MEVDEILYQKQWFAQPVDVVGVAVGVGGGVDVREQADGLVALVQVEASRLDGNHIATNIGRACEGVFVHADRVEGVVLVGVPVLELGRVVDGF